MKFSAQLESAFRYWRARPLRAMLSMSGIAAGVAGFVLVIALSEGARQEIEGMLSLFGTDILIVEGGDEPFPDREIERLRTSLEPVLSAIVPLRREHAEAWIHGRTRPLRVIATTPEYAGLHSLRLRRGRFLAPLDMSRRLRTCIVSQDLERGSGLAPSVLEDLLRFTDGRVCRIVGVLAHGVLGDAGKGGVGALPLENTVIVPLAAWSALSGDGSGAHQLQLRLRDEAFVPAAARFLERHFVQAAGAKPEILVPEALLLQKRRWQQRLERFLLGVAAIVLALGIAGMANTLLVSVDSRRREIGLRRAVGASRTDILAQFLIEGALLAFAGGMIGILFGLLLGRILHALLQVAVIQSPAIALVGTLTALLAGVLASLYPAYRAARLDPAAALRMS